MTANIAIVDLESKVWGQNYNLRMIVHGIIRLIVFHADGDRHGTVGWTNQNIFRTADSSETITN